MNHPYQFSTDLEVVDIDLQPLLVYQAEQRITWHQAIDTPDGTWNIGVIDPTLLQGTWECAFHQHCNRADAEFRARVSNLF